jgi:hypothetical protein
MAKKRAAPLFEVAINGRKACTSGIAGYGVVNVILSRVKRNPARYPGARNVRFNKADWAKEELHVQVGGLDVNGIDEHLHWLKRTLKPGDEIAVKVLAEGVADKPKSLGGRLTTRSTRTRAKKAARAGKRER